MKILIIKLHYIGDVVMITPALRRLRRVFPDSQIDILIGNWSSQVIINNPHVNDIIPVSDGWFSLSNPINFFHLVKLLSRLRSNRYDGVLVFHSNPSICRFSRAIGAPLTLFYHYENDDSPHYSFWDKKRHDTLNANALVDKFCGLAGGGVAGNLDDDVETEWVVVEDELRWAKDFLSSLDVQDPPVVIHPGAGVPSRGIRNEKQWFPEKFAALIQVLEDRGLGPVLLEGTALEEPIAQRIQTLLQFPVRSIMGMTDLRETAALLTLSRLLITNDTGTMHIGGAVGVPTVAIFGPTGSKEKLPYISSSRAVQSNVPCSPCVSFSFGGCLFDEYECMKEVSVDRVLATIDSLMGDAV